MKKITLFVMALMMAGSLFAYEPKKENVTVKGNKVQYYEEYIKHCTFKDTRMWTYKVKSGKFIYFRTGTFEYMWSELLHSRESYDTCMKVASYKDETCSTCAFLEKYKSAYENGELNETEMKQYETMVDLHQATNNLKGAIEGKPAHAETGTRSYYEVCANGEKMKCVNKMPFVTEENWYTITKEELLSKIRTFVEEVKAENN